MLTQRSFYMVKYLHIVTDWSKQTVNTQTRLQKQSDQGLHWFSFHLHLLEALLHHEVKDNMMFIYLGYIFRRSNFHNFYYAPEGTSVAY